MGIYRRSIATRPMIRQLQKRPVVPRMDSAMFLITARRRQGFFGSEASPKTRTPGRLYRSQLARGAGCEAGIHGQ
eukprot:2985148-Pyramimonas_sp.AAC.1